MSFRPHPQDLIRIAGVSYQFAEHPAAPGMVYGQAGRRGTVYQLIDEAGGLWALKVFLRQSREPRLVGQAERIQQYARLPGLSVCERSVLTGRSEYDLVRAHPELAYAVLMPWVTGRTWFEQVFSESMLEPSAALRTARLVADVLAGMEERGLAHCDLSGPNVILTPGGDVELVDLEEMYAPDLIKPKSLPGGSPGYAHKTAPEGLWRDEADRFSGAVLIGEMLGWADERVLGTRWGEGFFDPSEMGENTERFRLLKDVILQNYGKRLGELLEAAWFSDTPAMCPTFTEWLAGLPQDLSAVPEGELVSDLDQEDKTADTGILVLEAEALIREGQREDGIALLEQARHCSSGMQKEKIQQRIDELLKTSDRENAVPIGSALLQESWSCPICGSQVRGGAAICPFCEKGMAPDTEVEHGHIEALPVRPPLSASGSERKRRWVWLAGPGVLAAAAVLGLWSVFRLTVEPQSDAQLAGVPRQTVTAELTEENASTESVPAVEVETDLPASIAPVDPVEPGEMVLIPAGSFLMGSTLDEVEEALHLCEDAGIECDMNWLEQEMPQHEVFLDAYWMDRTEVTNAMYAEFLNEVGNQDEGDAAWVQSYDGITRLVEVSGSWQVPDGFEDHPVVGVTWYGAAAHCEWAGKRLPSEAEWERGARGDSLSMYPWGNTSISGSLANYCDVNCEVDWRDDGSDDGYSKTSPVGSYPDGASLFGLLDMAGNAREWVGDWFDWNYYASSPEENPTGPEQVVYEDLHASRGGSFFFTGFFLRNTHREPGESGEAGPDSGFRCARSDSGADG